MLGSLRETHWGLTIVTLGPEQSDSASVAYALTDRVELCPSFREAMQWAYTADARALIPCGYIAPSNTPDSWADIHFDFRLKMECYAAFLCEILPVSLARRKGATGLRVALHPAMRRLVNDPCFARHLNPRAAIICEMASKPLGVEATAGGECDFCIGSTPDIERYDNLEVLDTIRTNMAWTLYWRIRAGRDIRHLSSSLSPGGPDPFGPAREC